MNETAEVVYQSEMRRTSGETGVVRAIDVGYGNTKFVLQARGGGYEEVCSLFPSVTPVASVKSFAESSGMSRDTVKVPVGDLVFEVGRDAVLAQAGNAFGRTLDQEFAGTDSYVALVKGALHYMNRDRIAALVLGLPLSTWQSRRRELASRIEGEHKITVDGRRTVIVEHCSVVPQPLGGFYDYATGKGLLDSMANEVNLVIDPGYFTLDWLLTHGTKISDERSGAANNGGMISLLTPIANAIESKYGEIGNLSRLDAALLEIYTGAHRRPFRVGGQEIDLTDFFPLIEQATRESINRMVHGLGTLADIDNVILVGGGAKFFAPAVKAKFPKHRIHIGDSPVYANVRGFQVMGEEWLKRQKRI
ncbi:MAG: hypothetical protein BroJett021_33910 [Chloroflexota bacterium]|nr:MAG: hypothetical protein BroJett021_33910 [Chloroflexota bacterium]